MFSYYVLGGDNTIVDKIIYDSDCPICGKEMEYITVQYADGFKCNNKCYSFLFYSNKRKFTLFEEEFVGYNEHKLLFYLDAKPLEHIETHIIELIKYWKEKDRYLMKLLDN